MALDQLGLVADLKMYFLNPRASPQRRHLPGSSGFARLSTRPRAGAPALVKLSGEELATQQRWARQHRRLLCLPHGRAGRCCRSQVGGGRCRAGHTRRARGAVGNSFCVRAQIAWSAGCCVLSLLLSINLVSKMAFALGHLAGLHMICGEGNAGLVTTASSGCSSLAVAAARWGVRRSYRSEPSWLPVLLVLATLRGSCPSWVRVRRLPLVATGVAIVARAGEGGGGWAPGMTGNEAGIKGLMRRRMCAHTCASCRPLDWRHRAGLARGGSTLSRPASGNKLFYRLPRAPPPACAALPSCRHQRGWDWALVCTGQHWRRRLRAAALPPWPLQPVREQLICRQPTRAAQHAACYPHSGPLLCECTIPMPSELRVLICAGTCGSDHCPLLQIPWQALTPPIPASPDLQALSTANHDRAFS